MRRDNVQLGEPICHRGDAFRRRVIRHILENRSPELIDYDVVAQLLEDAVFQNLKEKFEMHNEGIEDRYQKELKAKDIF